MTQEEKELLLKDLSARLPYGVLCHINGDDTNTPKKLSRIEVDELDGILLDFWTNREDYLSIQVYLSEVKPYLRHMSSMTEEERDFANNEFFKNSDNFQIDDVGEMYTESQPFESIYTLSLKIQSKYLDWLDSHHFDYRGLIPMGLALEAPKGMYK